MYSFYYMHIQHHCIVAHSDTQTVSGYISVYTVQEADWLTDTKQEAISFHSI